MSADGSGHVRLIGAPLPHVRFWQSDEPLRLESGAALPRLQVAFETWGELDEDASNAVLVCHALSGDSHAARHDADDEPGWWEILIGPGKALDTDRFFVICSNVLGGCRGTTGPDFLRPDGERRYGAEFPTVTVRDMVEVQRRLLDHLGIDRLAAVVGGSLGGLQALQWGIDHSSRVGAAVVIAAAPRLSSQGIAFDVVGRNAIRHDARFAEGQYYDGESPQAGLALARMLAHITYLSDESMRAKFDPTRLQPRAVETGFESVFSVGSYLAYQGSKFVERFDANSYVTLTTAMDLFDLGERPEAIREALSTSTCSWLFLSFTTDWLYPVEASRQLVDALIAEGRPASSCVIESPAGHDSFLIEDSMGLGQKIVGAFLTAQQGVRGPIRVPDEPVTDEPTSIFYSHRLDYGLILRLLPAAGSVVDLGCGNGELLSILRDRGHAPVLGIERDAVAVAESVERGLVTVHADVDRGLAAIPDDAYDVALLSQTLQSILDVVGVLREIVRIAKRGIVSFPNFAHGPLREMFQREGRLPKEEGLYAYEWYETPNRRFPSILDFQELCATLDIEIEDAIYIDSAREVEVTQDPNYHADLAVVAIRRAER
ncbi:MAG: homoserine O-acetyltransferase [Deltaproteobacteria bacterium]|nr:homoserine O-acetyltransferase [Deltaproteobacteria bacterium]